MTQFNIAVTSDKVCPFCYLGKKRLERAIETYKKTVPGAQDDTFAVTWRAFYLDPDSALGSAPSRPIQEYLAERFGPDRVSAMNQRLGAAGAAEGIDFTFAGRVGSTRDAHRLGVLAQQKGPEVENAVAHAVFARYFEKGGDITSREMLVEAAAEGGLDAQEARSWLESGQGGEQVDREARDAVRRGIRGVPHFDINGKSQIGGAEDADTFIREFVKVKEAEKAKSG